MIPSVLDKATSSLLEDLQQDFDISFEHKNIDYCEVFQKSGKATIYYNSNKHWLNQLTKTVTT